MSLRVDNRKSGQRLFKELAKSQSGTRSSILMSSILEMISHSLFGMRMSLLAMKSEELHRNFQLFVSTEVSMSGSRFNTRVKSQVCFI